MTIVPKRLEELLSKRTLEQWNKGQHETNGIPFVNKIIAESAVNEAYETAKKECTPEHYHYDLECQIKKNQQIGMAEDRGKEQMSLTLLKKFDEVNPPKGWETGEMFSWFVIAHDHARKQVFGKSIIDRDHQNKSMTNNKEI